MLVSVLLVRQSGSRAHHTHADAAAERRVDARGIGLLGAVAASCKYALFGFGLAVLS